MIAMILTALCGLTTTSPLQTGNERVSIETPALERIADSEEQTADPSAPRTLGFYDMTDLLAPPGEPAKEFLLDPERILEREEQETQRLELFAETIRKHLRPGLTRGLDVLQTQAGGMLLLTGTAEQHAWTRSFLDLQRAQELQLLHVDSRYLRGKGADFEAAGFAGPSEVWEDESLLPKALEQMASRTDKYELVTAPSLTVLPAQPAYISIMNQVAYVKSYEVVYVHPGPVAIADPVIDVIDEGFLFDLTGIQVEEGLYALELKFERTEIERPIPTKEIKVAIDTSSTVTISQPVVTSSKLSSTVLLRDGSSVWFRIPDGDSEMLITVHLSILGADAMATDVDAHEEEPVLAGDQPEEGRSERR